MLSVCTVMMSGMYKCGRWLSGIRGITLLLNLKEGGASPLASANLQTFT